MFSSPIPSLAQRVSAEARRLIRADQGNIAVTFAIACVPLLIFIGAAVDYSRANAARSSMQSALDSTALMLSKDLSSGAITQADLGAKAQSYFTAIYESREAQNISVSATYTASTGTGSTIQLTGSGSIKTDFMQIAGFPTLGFRTSSTAAWGDTLLRVALVLDNTGSMNSFNKIGALKTASTKLVDQLSGLAQRTGDVMISLVPFALDVNVGRSNVQQNWLRWDMWDHRNSNANGNSFCNNGSSSLTSMAHCLNHGGRWNHTPNTSNKSQWNGCVADREQDHDITADVPASKSTFWVSDQDPSCPTAEMMPLTTDWVSIKDTIGSMTAGGSTNQTIGLQWGWLSLLQQSPLDAPTESPNNIYQHVIILFTDGLNTENLWSSSSTDVDARMKALCDNIKAQIDPKTGKPKYTIFTVQIDTDGAGQSPVLPYCASSPGNFYMLTQPSQIATAFSSISTEIAKLRVAR